jgi:hypothetical protein
MLIRGLDGGSVLIMISLMDVSIINDFSEIQATGMVEEGCVGYSSNFLYFLKMEVTSASETSATLSTFRSCEHPKVSGI